jgi:adenosylcobinamide-GDP ribazoletransferase
LIEAFSFLTVFGRGRRPSPAAADWFPVVGAVVGLALGAVWWLGRHAWPAPVAAALVVTADLAVTGMLHMDGLVDAADGLLSHLERSRRLAVMREPGVGAFGVAAAGAVLLLRWSALDAMAPRPLLLAGLWCFSRSAMAVVLARVPYAREQTDLLGAGGQPGDRDGGDRDGAGLASAFLAAPHTGWLGGAGVVAGAALAWVGSRGLPGGTAGGSGWVPWSGPVAVGAAAVAFLAVVGLARRRLGGFTGDVLGAAGVVGETVGLLVASARW